MKQQFLKDKTGTIRLTAYNKNRPIVPSSAQITLYKNDGTSEIQAQASVSVDATTGEMTYSLTTTHTATRGMNFKAVWEYVSSGVTYTETQLFDVVNSILSIPITDDDLLNELPSLKKANYQQTGTATAGSASSVTDTARRKEEDDYWKGGVLEILSGTGEGQTRDITGSVQSTGVVSVSPDFATAPDSTSVYRIVKSYSAVIEQCFEKIEQMLYNKGKRDALIMEASQIRIPLIYLTIQSIATDLFNEQNDKWDLIRQDYEKKFETAFTTLALDYDADESGGVQGDEAQQSTSSIEISRS